MSGAGRVAHVIDDDPDVRASLHALLSAEGFEAALYPSAEAFLDALAAGAVADGCVMTDLRLEGMDGLALLDRLTADGVGLPVVLMTGHGDVTLAVRALKAGAVDFIEKPFSAEALLAALSGAAAGRRAAGAMLAAAAADARARVAALSDRQRQVLDLLVQGKPNKIVAHELEISPRTVEIHRAHMMERLGAATFADAVRLAVLADLAE